MKLSLRLLVFLVIVAVTTAFAWTKWHRPEAAAYQTALVTRGELTQAVTATGTLNPVVNVQVGSQVSGNIQKLLVDFNSPVKAGQLVAQIDPAVFQANVTQAEGDLANARAALELARLTAQRTQALLAKQNTAQADVDAALAALHQAEASVKIKEGALSKAQTDLDHCSITSPIDGIVISRSVDVGQTVAASLSAPVIFVIANDLSKMQIDTNVAEADIGNVAPEQTVDFTVDAFPTRVFHGRVSQVRNAPVTVQNVVTYDTVIAVTNAELKLKPGMTANVSIVVAHRDEVTKLPNAALRFHPPEAAASVVPAAERGQPPGSGGRPGGARGEHRPERAVYVLAAGAREPKAVQVKLGISDGVSTEVLEGLNENDRVVTASTSNVPTAASAPPTNPFGGGPRRF